MRGQLRIADYCSSPQTQETGLVAFGAPMMMTLFLLYVGIAALIPFVSGLLGFSRLTAYLMTAALMCGYICLAAATFSDELKFQSVYQLVRMRIEIAAILILELLFVFILAHWLGARFRAVLNWVKGRLLQAVHDWKWRPRER
jgi:hypothetical protein